LAMTRVLARFENLICCSWPCSDGTTDMSLFGGTITCVACLS
jgi:hypothetical protein